jgi:hypothetical protein
MSRALRNSALLILVGVLALDGVSGQWHVLGRIGDGLWAVWTRLFSMEFIALYPMSCAFTALSSAGVLVASSGVVATRGRRGRNDFFWALICSLGVLMCAFSLSVFAWRDYGKYCEARVFSDRLGDITVHDLAFSRRGTIEVTYIDPDDPAFPYAVQVVDQRANAVGELSPYPSEAIRKGAVIRLVPLPDPASSGARFSFELVSPAPRK